MAAVIGEGGSGGALALGVADRILMLEYSVYSVISPEGCASILWRDDDKKAEAAAAMKMTARDLQRLGVVDEVVREAPGGAHRDFDATARNLATALRRHLAELWALPPDAADPAALREVPGHGRVHRIKRRSGGLIDADARR